MTKRYRKKFDKYGVCTDNDAPPIKTHSNIWMVREGYWPPTIIPSPKIKKSEGEKKDIKEAKANLKGKLAPITEFKIEDVRNLKYSLVVYIHNTKRLKHFKTTYSFKARECDIPDILKNNFYDNNLKINKAYYKNKPLKDIKKNGK